MAAAGRPATAGGDTQKPSIFRRLRDGLRTGIAEPAGSLVVLDLVVGFAMIFRVEAVGIPLPLSELAMLALVALSIFRRPTRDSHVVAFVALLALSVIGYVSIVTWLAGLDVLRRSIRIAGLVGLAVFIADGRIDLRSLVIGLASALTANIPLYYLGLTPDAYPPFLTGFLGDKNLAGLFYATIPFLIAGLAPRAWRRWGLVALAAIVVFLTGSRTSLAALGGAAVWVAVAGRVPFLARIGLGGVLYVVLQYIQDNFADAGIYEERTGSDALRGRIDDATLDAAQNTPWTGRGWGTATVEIDGNHWFFHNSYLGLWVEGGVVLTVAMMLAILLVIFRPFEPMRARPVGARWVEGAGVVILVCAQRLGEVFLTIPSFLTLGVALMYVAAADVKRQQDAELGILSDRALKRLAQTTP